MIITIKPGADAHAIRRELTARGLWVETLRDGERTVFLIGAHSAVVDPRELRAIDGIDSVATAPTGHPRIDAQAAAVRVGTIWFGHELSPVLMAGPCCIEGESEIMDLAARLAPLGVRMLRGGAYKPRTSPYSFQGHGREALTWLRRAAEAHGLGVVTEVMSTEDVPLVTEVADLVQVGSRNMQNFALLKVLGKRGRPVLLKRGMSATIEEWLLAGEYLLHHGSQAVIFCERGVRGFDPHTRNLLDLGAVALLSQVHRLPVVVDPSHAAGRRDLILPLSRAALAAGACGLLVEVHLDPGTAMSDGPQAISPDRLAEFMPSLSSRGKR